MADVFISYSRRNREFVESLHQHLNAHDRNTWVDWQDIPPTADWLREVYENIEQADTFLFVVSPDSLTSPICMLEVSHAIAHNKRLIPVVLVETEESTFLESLNGVELDGLAERALEGRDLFSLARQNWQSLARHNWLFFRSDNEFSTNFPRLIDAIDTDLTYVRAHTRLLMRANEWDQRGRDNSFLLRGADLDNAENWLTDSTTKDPKPTQLQVRYIVASGDAASRRQRLFLSAVSLALLLTIVLAAFALLQTRQARIESQGRAEQEKIAVNNANTAIANAQAATLAQGEAIFSAQTAVAAQDNAIDAQVTAERNALVSQSLYWAVSGQRQLETGNPLLAISLALAANKIPDPPPSAQALLSDIVYQSNIRNVLRGHETSPLLSGVLSVDFSDNGDFIVTSGRDGRLLLWEPKSGHLLQEYKLDEFLPEGAVFFNNDSQLFAYTLYSFFVFDVESGEVVRQFPTTLKGDHIVAQLSADETLIISAINSQVFIQSTTTGVVINEFKEHTAPVGAVAISEDNAIAISADSLGKILVWDTENGEVLYQYQQSNGITSLILLAEEKTFISGSQNGAIYFWDFANVLPIGLFDEHTERVNDLAISADERYLISGSSDSTLLLWDVKSQRLLQRYRGQISDILAVDIAPDDTLVISGAADNTLFEWDVMMGPALNQFKSEISIEDIAYSNDGTQIAYGTQNGQIIVRDATTWEMLITLTQFETSQTLGGAVLSLAFSPDDKHLLSGSKDTSVILWDLTTGEAEEIFKGHTNAVSAVAFTPSGTPIASGSTDEYIILWDVATGEIVAQFENFFGVKSLAVSPDGHYLAAGALLSGRIGVWDILTREHLYWITEHEKSVFDIAFSPDSQFIASAGEDRSILLIDVKTGEVVKRMEGHIGPVRDIDFNAEGNLLASSSDDGIVILWTIPDGDFLRRYLGHLSPVSNLDFNPTVDELISVGENRSIVQWDVHHTLNDLVTWACAHRYIQDFTATEISAYNLTLDSLNLCN